MGEKGPDVESPTGDQSHSPPSPTADDGVVLSSDSDAELLGE